MAAWGKKIKGIPASMAHDLPMEHLRLFSQLGPDAEFFSPQISNLCCGVKAPPDFLPHGYGERK